MADTPKTAVANFERDDIELVKLFLSAYKDPEGNSFDLAERPDSVQRNAKAIEAVAVDKHGHRLAIEHTMVEAFVGKKGDDVPFLAAFEQLRFDGSLLVPNQFIDVSCPALVIPIGKGIDWKEVGQKVLKWFRDAREKFPADRQSWHTIPDIGFELKVLVETMSIPGTNGVVVVSRLLPEDKPFIDVLRRALTHKVPKLVATPADRHILLLEDEGAAIWFYKLSHGIDSSVEALPDLKKVDEVWVVHTLSWKTTGEIFFFHVWPGGVRERFRIQDERFRKAVGQPTKS